MGTRDLNFYSIEQIKRVRLVKRADVSHDENAGLNILKKGLSAVRHTETLGLDSINASGETTSTLARKKFLLEQVSL